jgi:hypothetical protein
MDGMIDERPDRAASAITFGASAHQPRTAPVTMPGAIGEIRQPPVSAESAAASAPCALASSSAHRLITSMRCSSGAAPHST